jgi:RNA polymerase sigma-70 factor (ECF subfamily)
MRFPRLGAGAERAVPDNPAAWITAAAHRKILDHLRRMRTRTEKEAALRYESKVQINPDYIAEEEPTHFPDDRLRLIFTCCHPALNKESQVALTLRTLGGLTTGEIARGIPFAGGHFGPTPSPGQAQDSRGRNSL